MSTANSRGPADVARRIAATGRTVITEEWPALKILRQAGLIARAAALPEIVKIGRSSGPASIGAVLSRLHGERTALIDAEGPMTYRALGAAVNSAINGLRDLCEVPGRPTIAIMCRNGRHALIGALGAIGTGAKLVFLNTDLGAKQLAAVCQNEAVDVVIFDPEFTERLQSVHQEVIRLVTVTGSSPADSLASLVARSGAHAPARPTHSPAIVILTSGSSGTPKGALREPGGERGSLTPLAGFVEKIPLRGSDRIFVGPPMFHGWGLIVVVTGLLSGATLILEDRFNPERAVEKIVAHRCTALIAVPTMLTRLIALGPDRLAAVDRSQLRIIASGGAKLDPGLVVSILRQFGPVLHNLYGASEASFITIATPEDLIAEPSCAGCPPIGVKVAIVRDGQALPSGETGEIYARTGAQMSSYTSGETKPTLRGMIATGDTGWIDPAGRLFVSGRSDGMIVSGGENVFPEEVELALSGHPGVLDAKVVAVADPDFGQRLRAFIVASCDPPPAERDLKEHIATELSRSRVPRDLIYVDEIPRTATGKVTRQILDELEARHAPVS